MKFYGDLLLTDPSYIVTSDDDWQFLLSEWGDKTAFHLFGIRDFYLPKSGRTIFLEQG